MFRTGLSLVVVVVLLAAAGCTMCCHPYDYCGPVHDDQGFTSCSTHARAGSILAGGSDVTVSESPKEARRPARVVSTTKQVVQQTAASTDIPIPSATAEPSSETSKLLPASGWTARRPTVEITR
jgi:hypothetical protein